MKSLKGRGNYNYYAYCSTQNDIIPKDKELAAIAITSAFYDDLAHKDKTIHQSKRHLNNIKLKGIKERKVPLDWKTKLSYRDTVTEAISTDRAFATYLDHKSQIEDFKLKPMITSNISEAQHKANKSFFDKLKNDENNHPVEKNETRKVTRINFCTVNLSKKKDVESILDEYRGMFSMKKFIDDYKDKHKIMTTEPCLLNSTKTHNMTGISFNSIKGRRRIDKEEVFRSSIYGNLLPGIEEKLTVEEQMLRNQELLLAMKNKQISSGEFLHSNNEEYNRKIVITNPKIKKGLEMIDYYGPRYSHCKLCLNKNLEFYQNNEPNQCLELLAYLKRVKNKNKEVDFENDPSIICLKK